MEALAGGTVAKKSLDATKAPEISAVTWSLYNLRGLSFVHILLLLSVFFQSMKPSDPYLPLFLDETHGLDTRIVRPGCHRTNTSAYVECSNNMCR